MRVSNTDGIDKEKTRKLIKVKSNTLDSFCEKISHHDCFLFIDTQGYEGHVLSGSKKLLSSSVPIVTEFWPYGLARTGGAKLFYQALASSKYTSIYDLRKPNVKIRFSIKALKQIYSELGENGNFTDLLILRDEK